MALFSSPFLTPPRDPPLASGVIPPSKVFPDGKERLHVVISERVRDAASSQVQYDSIFAHLGAKPFKFEATEEYVGSYSAPAARSGIGDRVKARLVKLFAAHNERLFDWYVHMILCILVICFVCFQSPHPSPPTVSTPLAPRPSLILLVHSSLSRFYGIQAGISRRRVDDTRGVL